MPKELYDQVYTRVYNAWYDGRSDCIGDDIHYELQELCHHDLFDEYQGLFCIDDDEDKLQDAVQDSFNTYLASKYLLESEESCEES